ncbi:hypothetical protein OG216_46835 (plasmid) [Streptomycetaceae bacterium NBC_01309]
MMNTVDKTAPAPGRRVPARALRRRLEAERYAYVAATAGTICVPHLYPSADAAIAALGVAGAAGAWLYRKTTRADDNDDARLRLLRSYQRSLPLLTGAGLYCANSAVPGTSWWQVALPAAWGALMSWMTPITRAAGLTADTATPGGDQDDAPVGYAAFLEYQWQAAGIAPGTKLTQIHQFDPAAPDFEAVIVAQPGKAIPKLSSVALAAVFDFPEHTVTVAPVPGSGPGRLRLTARPTLRDMSTGEGLAGLWEEKVSGPGGAAPGMLLVDHRIEPDRIVLRVEAEEGRLINLPQKLLARALGIDNLDLLVIETNQLGGAVVFIYQEHPLLEVPEATIEDLTMDTKGRIRIGLRHDGRAARFPLWNPVLGAITDLFVGAPGAGKSVLLNTIIAAERISGVVSIVADAQDGMSLPEANGRTYHFGAGIAAVAATLAAAYEVARHRQKVSSANGWGGFSLNDPWPLANLTLDELNLILAEDADVPKEFQTWVVGMIAAFQSTGRKFGMGLRFAAQSIHLEDLGDKAKIRSNAKNGTVWMGRTNSTLTSRMATDGVIPAGVTLDPIGATFNEGDAVDAAFLGQDPEDGPVTAGMGWCIQGGNVFLARAWRAEKVNKTFPRLIELYESAPIPGLTPEEDAIFQAAYADALPYAERLLAGDVGDDLDDDGESGSNRKNGNKGGNRGTAAPSWKPPAHPAPSGGPSLGDRIVRLLGQNGATPVKRLREQLPDVLGSSVSDALTVLHDKGRVERASHGVWQLPGKPAPAAAPEGDLVR